MNDLEKQIYNIKSQISSYQAQYNSLSTECYELYMRNNYMFKCMYRKNKIL